MSWWKPRDQWDRLRDAWQGLRWLPKDYVGVCQRAVLVWAFLVYLPVVAFAVLVPVLWISFLGGGLFWTIGSLVTLVFFFLSTAVLWIWIATLYVAAQLVWTKEHDAGTPSAAAKAFATAFLVNLPFFVSAFGMLQEEAGPFWGILVLVLSSVPVAFSVLGLPGVLVQASRRSSTTSPGPATALPPAWWRRHLRHLRIIPEAWRAPKTGVGRVLRLLMVALVAVYVPVIALSCWSAAFYLLLAFRAGPALFLMAGFVLQSLVAAAVVLAVWTGFVALCMVATARVLLRHGDTGERRGPRIVFFAWFVVGAFGLGNGLYILLGEDRNVPTAIYGAASLALAIPMVIAIIGLAVLRRAQPARPWGEVEAPRGIAGPNAPSKSRAISKSAARGRK